MFLYLTPRCLGIPVCMFDVLEVLLGNQLFCDFISCHLDTCHIKGVAGTSNGILDYNRPLVKKTCK